MNGKWWLPLRSCFKGNVKTAWNPIYFLAQNLQNHNPTLYLRDDHFFKSGRSKVRIWARSLVRQNGKFSCSQEGATGPCILLGDESSHLFTRSFLDIRFNTTLSLFPMFFKIKPESSLIQNTGKFRIYIGKAVVNSFCFENTWKY
jgi:hypothetical protein